MLSSQQKLKEKGIKLKDREFPKIQEIIAKRHWEKLVETPTHGYKRLVQEFYAYSYHVVNDEVKEFDSKVRGKKAHGILKKF